MSYSHCAVLCQVSGENSGAEMVKHGFSTLLGGISKVLTIPPDDDDDDDMLRVTSTGNLEVFDKAKVRVSEVINKVKV